MTRPARGDVHVHIYVDRIDIALPSSSFRAAAAAPVPERTSVRPRMYGNDMFYTPERVQPRAYVAPAPTPVLSSSAHESAAAPSLITAFFNWIFGVRAAA